MINKSGKEHPQYVSLPWCIQASNPASCASQMSHYKNTFRHENIHLQIGLVTVKWWFFVIMGNNLELFRQQCRQLREVFMHASAQSPTTQTRLQHNWGQAVRRDTKDDDGVPKKWSVEMTCDGSDGKRYWSCVWRGREKRWSRWRKGRRGSYTQACLLTEHLQKTWNGATPPPPPFIVPQTRKNNI